MHSAVNEKIVKAHKICHKKDPQMPPLKHLRGTPMLRANHSHLQTIQFVLKSRSKTLEITTHLINLYNLLPVLKIPALVK